MLLNILIYGPIFITPRAFRISLLFWGHCFNYDEPFKMFSGNSSFSLVHTILLPVLSCALCSEVEIDFVWSFSHVVAISELSISPFKSLSGDVQSVSLTLTSSEEALSSSTGLDISLPDSFSLTFSTDSAEVTSLRESW